MPQANMRYENKNVAQGLKSGMYILHSYFICMIDIFWLYKNIWIKELSRDIYFEKYYGRGVWPLEKN